MPYPEKIGKKTRMSFSKIKEVAPMPNLIKIQTDSYKWFFEEGLREVFEDVSPIKDYAGNLVLEFNDYSMSDTPKYDWFGKTQRRPLALGRKALPWSD